MRVWHSIGLGAAVVLMLSFFAWLCLGFAWIAYVGITDIRPSESPPYWITAFNAIGFVNLVAGVIVWLSPSSKYFERHP